MQVPKPDGSLRFCVHFHRLNTITLFDTYHTPYVDVLLDKTGGVQIISTIDLTKGYWQIPLAKADRPKTAFATPSGLYQFTKMTFGLNGAVIPNSDG